jgi:hypothetical protein
MAPFDFSKPMFFGTQDAPGKGKKSGAFTSGLSNLSLGVDPAAKYRDLPFDCGNFPGTGTCCFNSLVGYPVKNNQAFPIHDYQMNIVNDMQGGIKYLCIKKARGIGITELMLRYMVYMVICKNYIYKGSKFFIVCGPREQTAIDLIKRIKTILLPLNVLEETQRTVASFLNVEIQSIPSSHVSTMRGYTDVKFIFIDEASFWAGQEQNEVRSVSEGYIAKTDPSIIMVSTPFIPNTMFEAVMDEDADTCLYKRYRLPYTSGLGKIYTQEEINKAKASPNFEREYNLKYGIGTGNLLTDAQIDAIIMDDYPYAYSDYTVQNSTVSLGCDPGFGSSKGSYCITGHINGKVIVLDCDQFERPSFQWFTELIYAKHKQWRCDKIFVDASARDVVDDLKLSVRERTDYEAVIKSAVHQKIDWQQLMIVVPVPFSKFGDAMLGRLVDLVQRKELQIPKRFDELILDLRMAREKNGKLDKTTNSMDLLDALRLSCMMYQYA